MARYRRRIYLAEGKLGSSMKFSYPNMHMQNTRRALVVVTLVCYLISISCCNLGATVVRRKIRNHRCIMRQDYADYWISGWWRGRCVCPSTWFAIDRLPLVFTGRTRTFDDHARSRHHVPRQFRAEPNGFRIFLKFPRGNR